MTISINDTQHKNALSFWCNLFIVMLNLFMLSVIMPHAIMLSVMVLVMLQSKKEKHLAILTNHSVILDDQHSELQLWLP